MSEDQHVTIFCAGISASEVRAAILELRNPAKGIHIEYIRRNKLGDHRVRIMAPTRAGFTAVRDVFWKLDHPGNSSVTDES